ncbi:hypothetical protein [Paraburkholderia sp. J8-2]|uniref:hypothetical protein n=1 Tax=Paraburkholderia sp. J8-2 TaxID=2805440 RepID=UPI002AB6655C|nr:hypothetical protein [Paraburkholderia sp. J8-2]
MRKVTLLLTLACVMNVAMADEPLVIKDTRQYMPYTISISDDGSCLLAKDPDHPNEGECHEARGKATVGGEYVIRIGNTCRSETYDLVKESSFTIEGRLIPSISTKARMFKCDAKGNAV